MENGVTHSSTTKRVFHPKEHSLEPYRKKPKNTVFQYGIKGIPRPMDITNIEYRDIFRMIALDDRLELACHHRSTPEIANCLHGELASPS